MPTPSMEDYLEKIYLTHKEKGYARASDIADSLDVLPSSVTKMMQRLDEKGLGIYRKYRGFVLTSKGEKIAKDMADKHEMLEKFLNLLDVPEEYIYDEVEGIEHHIGKETAFCIGSLVSFLEDNPKIVSAYMDYRRKLKK